MTCSVVVGSDGRPASASAARRACAARALLGSHVCGWLRLDANTQVEEQLEDWNDSLRANGPEAVRELAQRYVRRRRCAKKQAYLSFRSDFVPG